MMGIVPTETTLTTTASDGLRLAFSQTGTETPLVFVHGWCDSRQIWARQIEAFRDRFSIVALDLAGHGESGAGRDHWSIPVDPASAAPRTTMPPSEALGEPEARNVGSSTRDGAGDASARLRVQTEPPGTGEASLVPESIAGRDRPHPANDQATL